jgi:hypothetical protein
MLAHAVDFDPPAWVCHQCDAVATNQTHLEKT